MATKEIKIGSWIEVIARNIEVDAGEVTGIDWEKKIVHYRSFDAPEYKSTAPLSYVFPFDVTRGL